MKGSRLALLAGAVAVAGGVGWLAFLQAVAAALPPTAALAAILLPDDPRRVLDGQTRALMTRKDRPSPAEFAAVGNAARALPLDARPYLMFALRALQDKQERRALVMLEEARRRDPRLRLARLMLLDRYLYAGRNDEATAEAVVLARLLPGSASGLLVDQLVKLAEVPRTRPGVRAVLSRDPRLFNLVLGALAARGRDPAAIMRFAGRGAPAGLGADGWRTQLIDAQIKGGRYDVAYRIWADTYRIPPAARGQAVFNPRFAPIVAGPPFDWTMTADETGAADRATNGMQVHYYGRRDGALATQLLRLKPGNYRLQFVANGNGNDGDTNLAWTLGCADRTDKPFVTFPFPRLGDAARRIAGSFTIPANCPGPMLRLQGIAGQVAADVNAGIASVTVEPQP